jgi:type II secretory ATPase GspE/PulE/Tfp pilus assembly ATPase PilB-like protein
MHFEVRQGVSVLRMRIDGLVRMISAFPSGMVVDAVSAAYTVMAEERSRSNTAFNAGQVQAALIPLSLGEHEVSLRYQSHPAVGGFDVVLRLLKRAGKNSAPLSLERLGFTPWQNERLQESIASSWGGIFVAGVTGSGKTTTLNTLMTEMSRDGSSKLVTIEDPVEYEIAGVTHMSIQREASDDIHNPFHAAMMAFLRMDPDVGLFGEIRDAVSGRMAQAAIQTGHKILATVHAASAMGVISRLSSQSVGLKRDDLCHPEFISALLFQSLIPMNCQHCKQPALEVMSEQELQPYTQAFGLDPRDIFCASEHGCSHCLRKGVDYSQSHRNGVRGVKVAAEVLCPDTTLLKLLTQGQEFEARRYWRSQRNSPFNSPNMLGKEAWGHALYDVSRGLIDPYYFEKNFGKAHVLAKLTHETAA